ncbi:MAG TPA: purine-nucleoside phosphorylase [Vicinamibacterales bacterium]|nr:purine-nucleoside phosphorylase [Vicinamibacterales bacterium]
MNDYNRARDAADGLRTLAGGEAPSIGLILGSGLGGVTEALRDAVVTPYDRLPHWPVSGVAGHDSRAVVGRLRGRMVVALSGRSHVYEGQSLSAVTFAVRALGLLGVPLLVLTNSAGSVRPGLPLGTLMIIDDHVNLMGMNPLCGPNDERFGPRFPDMSDVYSARLRAIAERAARAAGVPVVHGVYAALTGPSYETPAEIRYLRTIGVDAVGMSTVPEAIVARHMGLEVLGISCLTNVAAGAGPGSGPLDHRDVIEVTRGALGSLTAVLEGVVEQL